VSLSSWFQTVRGHYERHPYPHYPLFAAVPRCDTYALNLQAIWAAFNGAWLDPAAGRILLAGCGAFAPYPLRLANPQATIDAVDLADANLRRARLHCLVHGLRGVRFGQGNFLDPGQVPGPYHFIDAFGVLHHLADPRAGFAALAERLAPGGVLRVMVYGRYARQEAESIRRACRLLGIGDVATLKRLLRRAPRGSAVRDYLDASWEARTDTGLADLFLHPCVHTYRIDEFLKVIAPTGLTPLRFTHTGALADPRAEIERLRELDRRRATTTNIICYLGRDARRAAGAAAGATLRLNPLLADAVAPWRLRTIHPMNRLGQENPAIDGAARRFLRRFRQPVQVAGLSSGERFEAARYVAAWYLLSVD
jgi:2-polyprenyl-3-methyl-5-hydroxy-6-metoxy-1,4-benzoquinol methylase